MSRLIPSLVAAGLGAALVTLAPAEAEAFSTRVHMMVANKVRDALIANGGTQIPLWQGGYAVSLSEADASSIIGEPEAFRAGAIGPDNMMFPGMTDPSHAIRQRPFEQCERLYGEAVLDRERAYALGCFLHGSTDAIAHHYVNFMTGETFTLTPITSGRAQSFTNVVRHIIAEEMIQDAAFDLDPGAFGQAELLHEIPKPFLLRTYFDTQSSVYALMGKHAVDEFNDTVAAHPGETLLDIILQLDVPMSDHLILLPVYAEQVDATRVWLRTHLEDEVAQMQDWNSPEGSLLQVLPGPDGDLGTKDDEVQCSASCPTEFVKYFLYAGLLAPRYDANNNPLPPAWDKVSDKFGADLKELSPSFVDVIENFSYRLNQPLGAAGGGLGDISQSDIESDFGPLDDWADQITTIDYQSIAVAVSPDWLLEMEVFFQSFGIDVDVAAWIEALLQPVIAPIRDGIKAFVVDHAKQLVGDLVDEYATIDDPTRAEYTSRLQAAKPPELGGGTMLDDFFHTGLYGHSFNITAAAFGNRAVVLPVGNDPVGVGPASFDCSHTQKWMQAGVCDHLRRVIFPLGIDVKGTMSLLTDTEHFAVVDMDSPIECHDGSLSSFTDAPSVDACHLTTLDDLLLDQLGTVSRAIPPELFGQPVECAIVDVPGLPGPDPGTGGAGGTSSGTNQGGPGDVIEEDSGCGCRVAGPGGRRGFGVIAALGVLAMVTRRGRRSRAGRRAAAVGAVGLALAACGGDDSESPGDSAGATSAGAGGAGGGSASSTSTATGSTTNATSTGAGGSHADELYAALDNTVWHAIQTRAGKDRAFEHWFDSDTKKWAEVRNPFGPSRLDTTREFVAESDGATVQAVDDGNGSVTTWTITIVPGSPRTLQLQDEDGKVETYDEGLWPEPTDGLTAEVRVFAASGPMADAYCKAGGPVCQVEYDTMFTFARGGGEQDLGHDIVAGAHLLSWYNVPNFTTTDVDGFDPGTLGGTELSDQFNFVVRYTGVIVTPGGTFSMRERDDDVGEFNPTDYGGVWAFLGDDVGVGGYGQLFLGVSAFGFCSDGSVDEPAATSGAGYVPVEIIMIRCNTDGPPVDVELAFEGEPYDYVGNQPTAPDASPSLFPPGL